MGEEKQNGEGDKKEDEASLSQEIVIKVDMHCQACARKVVTSLKGFQGVEDVRADCKEGKVVVKGEEVDPVVLCQRIQKKIRRKAEVISPAPPKPPLETKPEETKASPIQEDSQQTPAIAIVVLKVGIHCEACAQALQKRIRKIKGVESVIADISKDQVTVKSFLENEQLLNEVYKRTGKQATIEKAVFDKEENEDEKGSDKKQEDENKTDTKKPEKGTASSPPKYYMELDGSAATYNYAPHQYFSDDNPNACAVM